MSYRAMILVAASVTLAACTSGATQGATANPDLSGPWARTGEGGYGGIIGDPEGLKGMKPPMTPWGEAKFNSHIPAMGIRGSAHPNDTTTFKCLPPGIPRIHREPGIMDFYAARGSIVQVWEFNHLFRVIHMDVQEHPADVHLYPTWMGHSIGHWEGDTLVVDTVGFNDRAWLDRMGHPQSESLRVVERIRRVGDNLRIDVTIHDPVAYVEPWTPRPFEYKRNADAEFVEQICADKGDYDEVLEELTAKSDAP